MREKGGGGTYTFRESSEMYKIGRVRSDPSLYKRCSHPILIPSSVRLASGYTILLSFNDAASRRHKSIGYDSVSALANAGWRSRELQILSVPPPAQR